MTAAEVRAELAAAVKGAMGTTVSPYYRQTTDPGSAFIRYERTEYPNRFGGIAHWNVVVLLPQDLAEAEMYLEDSLTRLLPALAPVLTVREVVPQRLNIPGAGDLPCVFINGSREE